MWSAFYNWIRYRVVAQESPVKIWINDTIFPILKASSVWASLGLEKHLAPVHGEENFFTVDKNRAAEILAWLDVWIDDNYRPEPWTGADMDLIGCFLTIKELESALGIERESAFTSDSFQFLPSEHQRTVLKMKEIMNQIERFTKSQNPSD